MQSVLKAVYPDYPWKEDKFLEGKQVPPGYWRSKEHLLQAIEDFEKEIGIQKVCFFGT